MEPDGFSEIEADYHLAEIAVGKIPLQSIRCSSPCSGIRVRRKPVV